MSESRESFARVGVDGWAYAVELVQGSRPVRACDTRSLADMVEAWRVARGGGELLVFNGAAEVPEPDEVDEVTTGAGAFAGEAVVAVRYWSPADERPCDQAFDAAAAVMVSLYRAANDVAADGLRQLAKGDAGGADDAPLAAPSLRVT